MEQFKRSEFYLIQPMKYTILEHDLPAGASVSSNNFVVHMDRVAPSSRWRSLPPGLPRPNLDVRTVHRCPDFPTVLC